MGRAMVYSMVPDDSKLDISSTGQPTILRMPWCNPRIANEIVCAKGRAMVKSQVYDPHRVDHGTSHHHITHGRRISQ